MSQSNTAANVAHAEIDLVANKVIGLYEEQRAYLDSKPTAYLEELVHRAEDQRNNIIFSMRVGAEVNLAAASMVLQARRAKG